MQYNKEQLIKQISQEVEVRKDELVALLSKLISFPTVSPPARNTNEVQAFIQGFLNEQEFKTDNWEVYPGDSNVVGVLPGNEPELYNSLIVNGHVDVAEVGDDNEWDSSPFKATVKDDYVYGRGNSRYERRNCCRADSY